MFVLTSNKEAFEKREFVIKISKIKKWQIPSKYIHKVKTYKLHCLTLLYNRPLMCKTHVNIAR